jgi:hypothetical protein
MSTASAYMSKDNDDVASTIALATVIGLREAALSRESATTVAGYLLEPVDRLHSLADAVAALARLPKPVECSARLKDGALLIHSHQAVRRFTEDQLAAERDRLADVLRESGIDWDSQSWTLVDPATVAPVPRAFGSWLHDRFANCDDSKAIVIQGQGDHALLSLRDFDRWAAEYHIRGVSCWIEENSSAARRLHARAELVFGRWSGTIIGDVRY